MGWRCDNGGSPSANSMAVIPRDHTSHRESYAYSSCLSQTMTSCLRKMRAKRMNKMNQETIGYSYLSKVVGYKEVLELKMFE